MLSNELRIGNWLNNGISNVQVSAQCILEQHQVDITGGTYLNPIEITEEWLTLLGFRRGEKERFEDNSNRWIKSLEDEEFFTFFIFEADNGYHFHFEGYRYPSRRSVIIKHVHELQNLYYATTSEDLNYVKAS